MIIAADAERRAVKRPPDRRGSPPIFARRCRRCASAISAGQIGARCFSAPFRAALATARPGLRRRAGPWLGVTISGLFPLWIAPVARPGEQRGHDRLMDGLDDERVRQAPDASFMRGRIGRRARVAAGILCALGAGPSCALPTGSSRRPRYFAEPSWRAPDALRLMSI